MSVLVIGSTGFIGPHVVRALEARGREVIGASRRGGGPHGVAIDRRDAAAIQALVRTRRVTTVIDLLAYVEAETIAVIDALDGEVARLVMASSCDVYRNYEGLHRKAAPPPIRTLLAEGSPLRTTRYPYRLEPRRPADAPDAWMDDYDKIPLEAALRARSGLDGVIVRLPMVFGPGDRQRRFSWIARPMLNGANRLSVDPAWAAFRTTYGYVEDVADALAAAADHPAAAGRTFNLGQSDPSDHRPWIARFAAALDWRGEVVDAPAPADSPLASLDLSYPLTVDTGAFRSACDWREPTTLATAVARTVADEAARG